MYYNAHLPWDDLFLADLIFSMAFVTRSSLKPFSFTKKFMRPSSSGAVHFSSAISNVTLGSLNKRRASS
uniref:Flap endonuclease-1, putative n=1 Tax=Arundo donax TaxID=35708 RepID=A0A0A9CUQ4_ARUDO